MSMCSCAKCGDVYDTDFQMEVDEGGNCICDRCVELLQHREGGEDENS